MEAHFPLQTKYEIAAINEIHEWKNPQLSWFEKAMETINYPLEKAYNAINNIPGVEYAISQSIGGIVGLLNDFAQYSVRSEAIFDEYRKMGYSNILKHKDIYNLDLEHVDKVIGFLGAKYKSLSAVEGAAAGYVGLPGIPPDILALLVLNLRAIGEYATYCGFNVDSQEERLFALNILGFASSPNDAAKQVALGHLIKIAQDVARKKTWDQLNQHIFVGIVQNISKSLGQRLTKAKLAQIIPVSGAVIGGGFNAYYTNKVCDAAFFLYRERFLAQKYGVDIIEISVKPSDNYDDY